MEFQKFPKIPRLMKDVVITEKIDGTNAQVFIRPAVEEQTGEEVDFFQQYCMGMGYDGQQEVEVYAGSRNRWLSLEKDNFGFARWVSGNSKELALLGPGQHFGEWWGAGIQRRYGLEEKRFSLFNVHRWEKEELPACCHVVPTLYTGPLLDPIDQSFMPEVVLANLQGRYHGSFAAPGFMNPEGICVYHTAARQYFKYTLEGDRK